MNMQDGGKNSKTQYKREKVSLWCICTDTKKKKTVWPFIFQIQLWEESSKMLIQ